MHNEAKNSLATVAQRLRTALSKVYIRLGTSFYLKTAAEATSET